MSGRRVPGGDTPLRLMLRAVRILLECILVGFILLKLQKYNLHLLSILSFIVLS